jgi:hypothetical protein
MTEMLALLTALLLTTPSEFCAGYRQGFTAAYCAGHQFCHAAPVPPCPDASEDATWRDGYDRGYAEGERAHPDRH